MSDTTFVAGTPIVKEWLNEVNNTVWFQQTGAGVSREGRSIFEETIRVTDYSDLVFTHTAKSPGDPASHVSTSFSSWRLAFQAAFDEAFTRGGGVVVAPEIGTPYLIDDLITVKSNTTFICEGQIKLGDYTSVGGSFGANGDNIVVHNLRLDNSGLYAGGSGDNGVGAAGNNVKFYGGLVENCSAGFGGVPVTVTAGLFTVGLAYVIATVGTTDFTLIGAASNTVGLRFTATGAGTGTGTAMIFGDGGKGVQLEPGDAGPIVIDGMGFDNCFVAMSTIRDGGEANPYAGILYNNITANNCEILFFVRQSSISSTTGLEHTVQLNNFYARNCGAFEGVMQFSRASNVKVSNGIVVNDPALMTTPLIRGNHRNCSFKDVGFYSNCSNIIQLDPSSYAIDASQQPENNTYDIDHWGTTEYIANANITTSFRTLKSCTGTVHLQNDVSTAFFGHELRNGISVFEITQGQKTVVVDTAYGSETVGTTKKIANAPDQGYTIQPLNTNAVKFPATQVSSSEPNTLDDYEENTWVPTFTSDSGTNGTLAYTSSGLYTKIGRMVHLQCIVTLTNKGSRTGRVRIGGVPFSANQGPHQMTSSLSNVTLADYQVIAEVGSVSTTEVVFQITQSAAGGYSLDCADVANNSEFRFSGWFTVAT